MAGAAAVLGFAPFGDYLVPVLSLAVLLALLRQAANARVAARIGFLFGLGLFVFGIRWIYVALHDFGAMPVWLAALATLLFAAFLALFPALAAYLQARWLASSRWRLLAVMPAVWVLVEWLRGLIFTGFPWLTLGYTQTDSPLVGYAPLLGVYGVSWLVAVSAGTLVTLCQEGRDLARLIRLNPDQPKTALQPLIAASLLLCLLWGGGVLLRSVAWTQPLGAPLTVALLQGNVGQEVKFVENEFIHTLETYRRLAVRSNAQLTVLPETALPVLRHQVPAAWLAQLRDHVQQQQGDVLIGSFEREAGNYYNSVFSTGTASEQHYRKQHLVPFGEFIPLRPILGWFINDVLNIPMGDLTRGAAQQNLLQVAGQRIAVNICYEDVFGEELIRALPAASLLVNVTNDAWYGDSDAAEQHNQIARMRALETGRMMLRATNTGVTAIIGVDGAILKELPQHQEATLLGMAQGYQGQTPYVRWGNAAILLMLLVSLMVARRSCQRNARSPAGRTGLVL